MMARSRWLRPMSKLDGVLYSADTTTPFAHYEGVRHRLGVRVQSPFGEGREGWRNYARELRTLNERYRDLSTVIVKEPLVQNCGNERRERNSKTTTERSEYESKFAFRTALLTCCLEN